jgi:hypothetical protein
VTSTELRAIVEAEIGDGWSQSNAQGVDLRSCLVEPRRESCRNTFPELDAGSPLDLWVVLEETPGSKDGYLIVYDDQKRTFGLAAWDAEMPVYLGYYGTFMDTLRAM